MKLKQYKTDNFSPKTFQMKEVGEFVKENIGNVSPVKGSPGIKIS